MGLGLGRTAEEFSVGSDTCRDQDEDVIAQQIFLSQAALKCSPSWMGGFTMEAWQARLGSAKRRDEILGRCANTWIPVSLCGNKRGAGWGSVYGIRGNTRKEWNRRGPSVGLIPLNNVREEESRRRGLVVAQLRYLVMKKKHRFLWIINQRSSSDSQFHLWPCACLTSVWKHHERVDLEPCMPKIWSESGTYYDTWTRRSGKVLQPSLLLVYNSQMM